MNGSFNSEATTKLSSSIQHSKSLVGFSLALGLTFLFDSYYNSDFRALNFHVPTIIAAIIVAFVGALGYGWGIKIIRTFPGYLRSIINGIFSFVMAHLLCDFFGLYEITAFALIPAIALSAFVTGWRLTAPLFD
jgi:hypothetical protein